MEKKLFIFDLGNYNMKLTNTLCIRNDYLEFNSNDENFQSYDIEFNGKRYKFGTDTKFFKDQDKINREQLPMILYGINKCCQAQDIEAYLFLGVPNDEFVLRHLLIDRLKGKSFSYKDFKDVRYNVVMKDVKVYREGTGAWFTIDSRIRNSKNIVLLDIGGRTVNVIVSRKGIMESNYIKTIRDCGMIQVYRDLNLQYSKQIGKRQGEDTIHLVPDLIESGLINLKDDCYASILRRITDTICSNIEYIPNFEIYDIYLSGGGAEVFLPFFLEKLNRKNQVQVVSDFIFANRKGAAKIARTIKEWKEILEPTIR